MVRGSPSMCMRQHSSPRSATRPTIPGSPRRAVTSLTNEAPASTAASATGRLWVSIEIRAARSPAASRSITGSTRRSSSAAETGAAPGSSGPLTPGGRVDSPPMSTRSAPSEARRRACATAASGSTNRPPSEKESGVTLTTPMIWKSRRTGPFSQGRRGASRLLVGHRVGLPQLAHVRRLVGLAGAAAQRQDAGALGAGADRSGRRRTDSRHGAGVEPDPLALHVQLSLPAQHEVDLLLALLVVVVLGVLPVDVGRHVEDLHSERGDAQLGSRALERPAEDGLHLVDSLDRVVRHGDLPVSRRPIRRRGRTLTRARRPRSAPPCAVAGPRARR